MAAIDDQLQEWDNPLNAPDTLGRSSFAERLCESLESWASQESLVVAVYGPWGSGKTWLLNRIEDRLLGSKGVAVCRFSPWQFESNEQIATEFFGAVLDELEKIEEADAGDTTSAKRAELWRTLGQIVTVGHLGIAATAAVFRIDGGIPNALGSVGRLLEMGEKEARGGVEIPSVSELRGELLRLFGSPGIPRILVTIDDLDRLEVEQIQMILRLIKTTADLPNLNYLILGERTRIATALNPISGNAGDSYLEKLVQIPLTLPQAPESEIRGRLWDGLEKIADGCNYDLNSQVERFESFWRQFLRSKLKQYRSVHRLLTITSFHCRSLTKDGELEVDLLDLLGIDFIRLFAPKLYERIADDPLDEGWFLASRQAPARNEEQQDSVAALALLENGEFEVECAFHVLTHLFPRFYSLLPKTAKERRFYSNDHQAFRRPASARPISNDLYLPLYF